METNEQRRRGMVPRSAAEIATLPDAWLTPEETVAYIGLSALALNQRRHTGTGPKYAKRGRLIRYAKSALDAWLIGDSGQAA